MNLPLYLHKDVKDVLSVLNGICFVYLRNSEYREYQQEDALSFLTSILNGLHDEFKELDKSEGKDGQDLLFSRYRNSSVL